MIKQKKKEILKHERLDGTQSMAELYDWFRKSCALSSNQSRQRYFCFLGQSGDKLKLVLSWLTRNFLVFKDNQF